jgi:hypothetical protein
MVNGLKFQNVLSALTRAIDGERRCTGLASDLLVVFIFRFIVYLGDVLGSRATSPTI